MSSARETGRCVDPCRGAEMVVTKFQFTFPGLRPRSKTTQSPYPTNKASGMLPDDSQRCYPPSPLDTGILE